MRSQRKPDDQLSLLHTYRKMGEALLSSLELDRVLDLLIQQIVSPGLLRSATIALVNDDRTTLEVVRAVVLEGDPPTSHIQEDRLGISYPLDSTDILAEATRTARLIVTEGWDERFNPAFNPPGIPRQGYAYFIPLQTRGRVVGVLATGSDSRDKEAALQRIDQLQPLFAIAAAALEHAALYSALQESEREMRRQRDQAQLYLDVAQVILVALDAQGRVTLINRKGRDLLGYQGEELIGRDWFETCIPEAQRRRVREVFATVMSHPGLLREDERGGVAENEVLTRTGQRRLIRWHNTILTDESGRAVGTLSSGTDITEQRELERRLRHAERLEAVGTLAGGIAHDFNNLLTSILGYTELAMSIPCPNTELRQFLAEIQKAGKHAATLTNRILSFSGRQMIRRQAVEVDALLSGIAPALRSRLGRAVELELDLGAGGTKVELDPHYFEQIIHALLDNALEAMPAGGMITIETSPVDAATVPPAPDIPVRSHPSAAPPRGFVRLTMRDCGIGMEADVLARAFEPFYTTKGLATHDGLGLAMVWGLIHQVGGRITLESTPGHGASVHLYLPAASADSRKE